MNETEKQERLLRLMEEEQRALQSGDGSPPQVNKPTDSPRSAPSTDVDPIQYPVQYERSFISAFTTYSSINYKWVLPLLIVLWLIGGGLAAFAVALVAITLLIVLALRSIRQAREKEEKQELDILAEKWRFRERQHNEENARRYAQWLKETPAKLSQGGLSSLDASDRNELFLIYQLLMNGGNLNAEQNRLMEIALADPATSKFLELRGSQGATPSPTHSINPQMAGAFSALGFAGAAGIWQRGKIRQELNEINENLEGMSEGDVDPGGGFDPDAGGFDPSGGGFF